MAGTRTAGAVLGRRALNRALLARQLLLERVALPAREAVERLVGLQAQAPDPPYVGLWSRLEGFDPAELGGLLTPREAVRATLLRGTIHLVTAEDCLALRPAVQPVLERSWVGAPWAKALRGLDLGPVLAEGRALLAAAPRTRAELAPLLAAGRPDRDPAALASAVAYLVPTVQVTPRGVWGAGGRAALTTVESWLGRPLAPAADLEDLVLRYLGAFGPASVADAQVWSGLIGLGGVVDRLRPRLVTFRDEAGRELFDLPGAPRPDSATPAPPRLVAEFDNLLLAHADRSRVIDEDDRRRIWPVNGLIPGTVLVDGFVAGTWKLTRARGAATMRVVPFAPWPPSDREGVEREAGALLAFAAPGAAHSVEVCARA